MENGDFNHDDHSSRRSNSLPMTTTNSAFFPSFKNRRDAPHLERERAQGPTIFDKDLVSEPIFEHDDYCAAAHYPEEFLDDGSAAIPTDPEEFKDPYLFPRLSKDELRRLTSLWYYTRNIQDDEHLLKELQKIVNMVHNLMGRDCTILGLMDHDFYTRIVTQGCPLAILPRREATCAHTINQKPGSVFMLPNMLKDWRFKNSPHVVAGLRFYAGTALRYRLPSINKDVVFGSLCVASYEPREPLSKIQQQSLSGLADMVVHAIVERAELHRMLDRERLSARIASISKAVSAGNVIETVVNAIQAAYPNAIVSHQTHPDDVIEMKCGRNIPFSEFQDFLWEDSDAIHKHIAQFNHIPWMKKDGIGEQTFRAIAIKLMSLKHSYIVLESIELKKIFDDIDVNFVTSGAMLICNTLQAEFLRNALEARTQFMRGMSHELRTPIHGILSTCELLQEELSLKKVKSIADLEELRQHQDEVLNKIRSMLTLVDASGRDLLATINNLLDFDKLESGKGIITQPKPHYLDSIEKNVVDAVVVPPSKPDLTVVADCQLPPEVEMVITDFDLLKQCLTSLLQNAVNFTERGTIIFRTNLAKDYSSLEYEVIDTGMGIAKEDQDRIFEPYVKVDPFSRGPGLGLCITSKIAQALNGTVEIISSTLEGSHFRLTLRQPTIACQRKSVLRSVLRDSKMPLTYHMPVSKELETLPLTYMARNLERLGFRETDKAHATLDIIECTGIVSDQTLEEVLSDVASEHQIAIYISQSRHDNLQVAKAIQNTSYEKRVVRCFTPTCRVRIWEVLRKCVDIYDKLQLENKTSQKEKMEDPPEPPSRKRPLDDLHLLLVDDNLTNLGILKMYCKKRNYGFETALDGKEAVEKYRTAKRPFTLVLMDLQMPVMDGVEATAKIREYEKEDKLPSTLVFMVTGQSTEEDKRRSVEAGANGYYVKPVSIRTLDDVINLHFPV